MWTDEGNNEEPEYAPPSRETSLAILRRRIGRVLQARYEVPLNLPKKLQELVAKLDS
jgi:hypothetical protein